MNIQTNVSAAFSFFVVAILWTLPWFSIFFLQCCFLFVPCSFDSLMSVVIREQFLIIWRYFRCRFQVFYTVSQPTPEWDGYEGRVSMEMLLEILPSPPSTGHERELLICVCGPDPFTHHVIRWVNLVRYRDFSCDIRWDAQWWGSRPQSLFN